MEIVEVILLGFIVFQCWFNYKTDKRIGMLYDIFVQGILRSIAHGELDNRTEHHGSCSKRD